MVLYHLKVRIVMLGQPRSQIWLARVCVSSGPVGVSLQVRRNIWRSDCRSNRACREQNQGSAKQTFSSGSKNNFFKIHYMLVCLSKHQIQSVSICRRGDRHNDKHVPNRSFRPITTVIQQQTLYIFHYIAPCRYFRPGVLVVQPGFISWFHIVSNHRRTRRL